LLGSLQARRQACWLLSAAARLRQVDDSDPPEHENLERAAARNPARLAWSVDAIAADSASRGFS
jgi:hypothetical protein